MKQNFFWAASAALTLAFGVQPLVAQTRETSFRLFPNPPFAACLGEAGKPEPVAGVKLIRGERNDFLQINVHNLRPNLAFDLFTVQNSPLIFEDVLNPAFKNFGLAWYQSDLKADENGDAEVRIETILLDQIFGFDPAVNLVPTNTFHLGFWFNDPKDAVACGFNASKPTPFNGEHKAGPLAMITVPNPTTHLGPLCTSPTSSGACNP